MLGSQDNVGRTASEFLLPPSQLLARPAARKDDLLLPICIRAL